MHIISRKMPAMVALPCSRVPSRPIPSCPILLMWNAPVLARAPLPFVSVVPPPLPLVLFQPNMDVVSSLPPSHWPSPAAPSILNGAPAGRGGRMGSSPPPAQHQHHQQQQQPPHLQHYPQQEAVAAAVNALHRAPGGGAVAPQAPVSAPVEGARLRMRRPVCCCGRFSI